MSIRAGRYICPCTFVDGKVYPDPNQHCANGHTRGEPIDEAFLLADLDAILTEANTEHRPGCASSRARDCTCEYLAQWDAADIPEPPVTEGCTRHYPEGGGYLDIPNHLTKAFLTGETA